MRFLFSVVFFMMFAVILIGWGFILYLGVSLIQKPELIGETISRIERGYTDHTKK